MRGDGSWPVQWQWEWGNSVYILKVESRGFAEELIEGLERKEGTVNVDNNDLGRTHKS